MPSREELYTALRNADKAGDADGARKLAAYIQALPAEAASKPATKPAEKLSDEPGVLRKAAEGAALGISDVGNTVLNAVTAPLGKALPGVAQWNRTRNADFEALTEQNKDSTAFQVGRIGAQIGATAPVGGALAGVARAALPAAAAARGAPVLNAIASAGMRTGAAPPATFAGKAADLGIRALGGAVTGGTSAGLVDPSQAGTGAAIGAALPGAAKLVGAGAQYVGGKVLNAVRGSTVAPEVTQLAMRAKELGINVPADRIANSKPLNALAASLNYVPGSGRAATERTMQDQLNRALSKTFGQDSDNVTAALRKAREELGGEFDRVLQQNTVRVDDAFLDTLVEAEKRADAELGTDGAKIVKTQINEILSKASETGEVSGQAAYNIKKTLDRIGKRNSPEAYYASDLKRDLMEALNRSMAPEDAAAFAKTRQRYGNMLTLDKLAQNGVDGDVSIARIANMKNIGNKDLQELADISAQFLKAREGQHGAAQRTGIGGLMALLGGPAGLVTGVAAGRATNTALNSNRLKGMIMGQPAAGSNRLLDLITNPQLRQLGYRAAPVVGGD